MSLQPGQTVSHYRIEHKLGEGGMGEVWAATDTRLNRSAAIKALPVSMVADAEWLARFNREAQLLAALNHPNIAAIYGLERSDDVPYLALELVEGDDLSTSIEGRRVPLDEVQEIALQIAAALEEAHEKGIIHRDLKPANIKLATDGRVKVLDFGLAKALSQDPDSSGSGLDVSTSPTMTAAMGTQAGLILGTAGYMSPEQARGKALDRRTDVWAFGVILYEMLTGTRLFSGETVTDVIAAVVTREPDWSKLPADTSQAMRRVLKRCLQKDPRQRLRDIGDAALELREPLEEEHTQQKAATVRPPARSRNAWLLGAAGLVLGAILTYAILSTRDSGSAGGTPLWSNLQPPEGAQFDRFLEISPDGQKVVFVAPSGPDGDLVLWVRELGNEQARALAGTEGADQPFWSPDSRSIGFFARRKVRRISAEGGVSQTLAQAGTAPRGASWGADGTILFVPDWSEPVFRVSETGGEAEIVSTLNVERMELSHRWPHMLPDGKHFLYFVVSTYPEVNPENPAETDQSGLYVGSFDGAEPRLLQTAHSRVVYRNKSLIYVDDGILMSRPFDLTSLSFSGDPVTIASDVTQSTGALWGGALFSVSDAGTLLFVRGATEDRRVSQLMWIDRKGERSGLVGRPQSFNSLQLSHDGTRLAASTGDPEDVWIYDFERNNSTRLTFDIGSDNSPVWSPDDEAILFSSTRVIPDEKFMPVRLYRKAVSGLEEEDSIAAVESFGPTLFTTDWSSDGKYVATTVAHQGTGSDLVIFSIETNEFEIFLQTEDTEQSAKFSPSGRWLAFESDVSGEMEVYVRAFPGPGGEWQVSTNGGIRPLWRADGRELFYLANDGQMMSVVVESKEGFRHDTPVALFEFEGWVTAEGTTTFEVAPDGSKFLVMGPVEGDEQKQPVITLLQGWY
jgi:serine/threonine protein kinase